MSALPGRPPAALQAVTVAHWDDRQIIAYISGHAFVILDGPNSLLQTIYLEQDQPLVAIDFDEGSGKIAVCSPQRAYVYRPYGQEEHNLRWSLQSDWAPKSRDDALRTLSWGTDEELLVGSKSLTILATGGGVEEIWSTPTANPVKFASFSHDASLVATTGWYDRLLKVWKRLIFGSEGIRFDTAYLPHPAPVTQIHWRRPRHREQHLENVLYTACADKKVRIWAPMDSHGLQILQLWGVIDLMESIQPRSIALADRSDRRFAFIIDSRDFSVATERAVQQASNDDEAEQHALHHLIEVANRTPEVCVVLDDRGNMSAWGLERVGCKDRRTADIFNVAHVEGLHMRLPSGFAEHQDYVRFYNFCGSKESPFALLTHHFDGRVDWYNCRLDKLFDPMWKGRRLDHRTTWTGHSGEIKKVVRTALGRAIISRTTDNESIVWRQRKSLSRVTDNASTAFCHKDDAGLALVRHSTLITDEHIHRSWLLQEGNFVVLLHHESISVWDCHSARAVEIARRSFKLRGQPVCLLRVPETQVESNMVYMATISSEFNGIAWEITLPTSHGSNRKAAINDFGSFSLGSGKDLSFVLPVDPAGTAPVISGFLDVFARDVAISYTTAGVLRPWTARVDSSRRTIEWLSTATIETGFENPFLASGTSIRKAALVDAKQTTMSIWSTQNGALEYEETFDTNILDLDWASTPDNQSILAVGFAHKVLVYSQLRYDYLDAGSAWASIRSISIRDFTPHPIGDSVWLGSGCLAICAGNQLFLQDNKIALTAGLLPEIRQIGKAKYEIDVFDAVSRLNGPIPAYHPQFIGQCILSGKVHVAQQILLALYKKLKFFSDGDELENFLGIDFEELPNDEDYIATSGRKELQSSYAELTDDIDPQAVTETVSTELNELLAKKVVPRLSSKEQLHLVDIIECIGQAEKHRRSLDEHGCRFLLFFRQHVLRSGHGSQSAALPWREIVWAYYSNSQDILLDLVSRHFNNRILWKEARESGIFMWMTDITAVRAQFETVARNIYTASEDRNPVDCSLFYVALKKKAVLAGLWRMAIGNKEKITTQKFLANNFDEARWGTAALKNAYALMGKRRFEYAAAFFLLGADLKSAVNVLANQMADTQLAIAVARVYEGDDGLVLREFLEERILPEAVRTGNRWMANWAFWMLGKRDKAVRALISPLSDLVSPPQTPKMEAMSFLNADPALVVLYRQLRAKSLQTLKGALAVSPAAEWSFITYIASIYCRMGCDPFALDLVKNWEFLRPPPRKIEPLAPLPTNLPQHSRLTSLNNLHQPSALDAFEDPGYDPRSMLRRRRSSVVADLPSPAAVRASVLEQRESEGQDNAVINGDKEGKGSKKAEEKKQPPPTQFQEPDANSLLDSFGF